VDSRPFNKILLRLFIVSIISTAVLGIVALSFPTESWALEIKACLTTAILTAASVCGLACGGCLTRGHRVLPMAGLVLTPISACLLLLGMWVEIESETYWKLAACLAIFAVACAHLSMLFMANLAGSYRWAYLAAYQLVFGLAAMVTVGIVFELFGNDRFWRLTGGVSILVAAITLLIPVFHYMSRELATVARTDDDPLFAVEQEIARTKKNLIELENKRRILLGRQ
jgi:hypothetical protein